MKNLTLTLLLLTLGNAVHGDGVPPDGSYKKSCFYGCVALDSNNTPWLYASCATAGTKFGSQCKNSGLNLNISFWPMKTPPDISNDNGILKQATLEQPSTRNPGPGPCACPVECNNKCVQFRLLQ